MSSYKIERTRTEVFRVEAVSLSAAISAVVDGAATPEYYLDTDLNVEETEA
jgi:hypothetical protein